MTKINILHLSDIHFSKSNEPDSIMIWRKFIQSLKNWKVKNQKKTDLIFITGDIANSGKTIEYQKIAKENIQNILEVCECKNENLFIVAGNHDVDRDLSTTDENDLIEKIITSADPQNEINKLFTDTSFGLLFKKFNSFDNFLKEFGKEGFIIKDEDSQIAYRPFFAESININNKEIKVIGVNSALLCNNNKNRHKIYGVRRQLVEALNELAPNEKVIILSHYPTNWLNEEEEDAVPNLMARYKVIHFYGHIHKESVRLIDRDFSSFLDIGVGSLFSSYNYPNNFMIVELDYELEQVKWCPYYWNKDQGEWKEGNTGLKSMYIKDTNKDLESSNIVANVEPINIRFNVEEISTETTNEQNPLKLDANKIIIQLSQSWEENDEN